MYSRDTEIRHISSADVFKLGQILDQTNSWKKLMRIIPRNLSTSTSESDTIKKYNNDHIRLIENASIKQNRMSTEILFEEWGTSGKKRPTVGNLLELLIKAELFRAADFVAINFLNEPSPERPLKGPAAKIDISLPLLSEDIEEVEKILDDTHYPGTRTLLENAQIASEMNNKDFYEKVTFDDKNLTTKITQTVTATKTTIQSDLMKFSSDNIENNLTTTTISENNIPILSELDCSENKHFIEFSSLNLSFMNGDHHQQISNSNENNYQINDTGIDDELPNLSVLQNHGNDDGDDYSLPQLSVLNGIDNSENGNSNKDNYSKNDNIDDEIVDEELFSSNSSSISNDSNILTPNLSILDQSGGLNDSSLTTVTETSEDSSFSCDGGELKQSQQQQQQHSQSMESFQQSDSNIPCISALNN